MVALDCTCLLARACALRTRGQALELDAALDVAQAKRVAPRVERLQGCREGFLGRLAAAHHAAAHGPADETAAEQLEDVVDGFGLLDEVVVDGGEVVGHGRVGVELELMLVAAGGDGIVGVVRAQVGLWGERRGLFVLRWRRHCGRAGSEEEGRAG